MASLQELTSRISSDVAQVTEILAANKAPFPTLDESSHVKVQEVAVDAEALHKAKSDLINAAQDMMRLAQGPIDHIITLSYADLAISTSLAEDILTRIVRYGIANGIFVEPLPNLIGHSAASATLAQNKSTQDVVHFNTGLLTRVVSSLADTLQLQQEKAKNAPEAAFNYAYPGYVNIFEYFAKHANASRDYCTFLDGRAQHPRYSIRNVVAAWDWAKVGTGTILDLGGSSGATCFALAPHSPLAKFVVQDVNVVGLNLGRETASKNPDLHSRVAFVEHNFFESQNICADVYIFRLVLHDWNDTDCIRIRKALIPALKDGARILVSEDLMPEPRAKRSALLDDKQARVDDFVMLGSYLARERSVDQFTAVFKQASDNYHLVGVTGGTAGTFHSLVEYIYSKT